MPTATPHHAPPRRWPTTFGCKRHSCEFRPLTIETQPDGSFRVTGGLLSISSGVFLKFDTLAFNDAHGFDDLIQFVRLLKRIYAVELRATRDQLPRP